VPKNPSSQKIVSPPTQSSSLKPTEALLYFLFRGNKEIDSTSVTNVKKAIQNSTLKKLHLIVDSPGGDAYSAVKIIRILRTKFDTIVGFVPFTAMSAATLMLLGTDEIYMSEESQLGPLDLPMEHPLDGTPISALDVVNTLNQLSTTMMNNAVSMYQKMREDLPNGEKIGKTKAMELALSNSVELTKQTAGKIDPYHRQKAFRKLKIAQWYAYDLLRTGMMKGKPSQSWDTASNFVSGFPDHSYAIFKEEAKETLMLTVKDSKIYPGWDALCLDVQLKRMASSSPVIEYIEK